MAVNLLNVDMWFGAFSAPFFVCLCQTTWIAILSVYRVEGEWVGCGIEDHEVHDGENVKEVCRLGEPPMWHITLPVSKGGFP